MRRALTESSAAGLFETGMIAAGFAALFFLLPHSLANDDLVRFADIEGLLHHGHLSDSRYSLVMPLLSAPLLLLGELVRSPAWWAERFNVVVVAAAAATLWVLLRGRIDRSLFRRTVLVLLFASFLTSRLRDYNAEVTSAALITVGIVLLETGRRRAGWATIVIGVVNTPAAIVGLLVVAAFEAARRRDLRPFLPVVGATALIMLEAWIRRGGPLTTGYAGDHGYVTVMPYSGRPTFSYPFVFGVFSILFSFGRGLVFFMPGLVLFGSLALRRAAGGLRTPVTLLLLFTTGLVLVYAKWWAWYGGIGWGPRFFLLAAVPASIALVVALARVGESALFDGVVLAVLIGSAWVGLSGAIADLATSLGFCASNGFADESLCWYTPEFSPLGQPLVHFPPLHWSSGIVACFSLAVFTYLAQAPAAALWRAAVSSVRGLRLSQQP